MITLLVIIGVLLLSNVYFVREFFINRKFQKKITQKINSYESIGTGRFGFYKYNGSYSSYNAYVYVKEVDRYNDGYSKIQIDSIEAVIKKNENEVIRDVKNSFLSLRKTSEIEWLESEDHLRKARKQKLSEIKKIYEN